MCFKEFMAVTDRKQLDLGTNHSEEETCRARPCLPQSGESFKRSRLSMPILI